MRINYLPQMNVIREIIFTSLSSPLQKKIMALVALVFACLVVNAYFNPNKRLRAYYEWQKIKTLEEWKKIKTDEEMESFMDLSSHSLRGALIKYKTPKITEFQYDKSRVLIFNYTDQQINITKNYEKQNLRLNINGIHLGNYLDESFQILAYSLENMPEILCIEQKSVKSSYIRKRLIRDTLDYKIYADHFNEIVRYLPKISEKIYQRKIFIVFLMSFSDENSFFYKNVITKDIVLKINEQYNNVIEKEHTPEYLNTILSETRILKKLVHRIGHTFYTKLYETASKSITIEDSVEVTS